MNDQIIINENNIITILNICNYNMSFDNNNLILTPINKTNIDKTNIFNHNYKKSYIIECKINNESFQIKKYVKLLRLFYSKINDRKLILNNTLLNIKEEVLYDKGFDYWAEFGFSIQGNESINILKEINNLNKITKILIELKIHLFNDEIIIIYL